MRQGNGTDILGLNDPRAASIGIIYVSPKDDRKSVLAAIIMQEKFGRKQVAVVLPPQNRAFQRPVDFDDLKSMRNRLQTEVVFIAPSGPGPGEFARQRRFPVYSSLESYAQALREEQAVEDAPKKGWFGGAKPKSADATPPSPPTPQQEEDHAATGHPAVPFVGGMLAGGAAALAADHALHAERVADASPAAPVPSGAEDDFALAPDPSVPHAATMSPPGSAPTQTSATNAPNRSSSPDPGIIDLPPKQSRITADLSKAGPTPPIMLPPQSPPMSRASNQPNSGKTATVRAGRAAGATGGILAGRAATSGGAPPILRGTPSGAGRTGGSHGRRRFTWLIALALLLLTLLLCAGAAFAQPNLTKMVTYFIPNLQPPSPTVTITPASKVVQDSYGIQAVTGTANAAQHQVAARILTARPSQQKIATATGHNQMAATPAKGVLTFINGSNAPYTFGIQTPIVSRSGVTFYLDAPVAIPAANPGVSFGVKTGNATAAAPGARGNIAPLGINIKGDVITIRNVNAFTGGQDAKNYSFLKQSDIDSVATSLSNIVLQQAQSEVKSQIRLTEQPATPLQCSQPSPTSNEPVGDTGVNVTGATVTVAVTCTQEVYDQQGLQTLVGNLLKAKAATDLGSKYTLVGNIVPTTTVRGVDPKTGTISLLVNAKGQWVYQFSDADKKALAELIVGLSADQATAKLKSQPGVVDVSIPSGVTTFPSDPAQITLNILPVTGFSGGGGTPIGPGSTSTPSVPGPTSTPTTGTPVTTPGRGSTGGGSI